MKCAGNPCGSRHFAGEWQLGVRTAIIFFFVISLLFTAGCQKSERLVLESAGYPERVLELRQDRVFSLKYTHSVEKTPVIETFQVQENGTLLLISTRYKSYGVGLPSLPQEGKLTVADGWLTLEGLQRQYRDIRVRVGPEAGLVLEIGRQTYPVHEWYPPGSLVIIRQEFLK